jgi:pimeloyl-ACP methyl ester carboxylesterase
MSTIEVVTITTARGITCDVQIRGANAVSNADNTTTPIVFLHGTTGLFDPEPLLDLLARDRTVYSPVWPGYGVQEDETKLEDMLDFALHGADVIRALSIGDRRPILVGQDMGAMIAAEMASLAPDNYSALALISPLGLWDDATPIPDIFTKLPFEFPELLFADVELGTSLLSGGMHFEDPSAIETFQVRNARRLGMAGKILFPIPNRRLSKRLYRCTTPTLMIWGSEDRLTPTASYGPLWSAALPHARTQEIADAGHAVHVEQPEHVYDAITGWLDSGTS